MFHVEHKHRLGRDGSWVVVVIKNEDHHGSAVSMTREVESEPALVDSWTTGRDGSAQIAPTTSSKITQGRRFTLETARIPNTV